MGLVIDIQSWERNAAHNATWKSSIPHAHDWSFTSSTATCRTNLPAGFITVMNDCSLASATLGKVGHNEPFSLKKKKAYDRLMNVWGFQLMLLSAAVMKKWNMFLFIKQKTRGYCMLHTLHHVHLNFIVYDSRLVQRFSTAYRGWMATRMKVCSACMWIRSCCICLRG